VVTNGASDDCNGEIMADVSHVYLQIARRGDHWALHHSLDGAQWKMARYLRFPMPATVRAGFEAQSPVGDGATAHFSHIRLEQQAIANLRQGI
jgi:regulation of enolase protein 1 (concanavalin A-like superfamily)